MNNDDTTDIYDIQDQVDCDLIKDQLSDLEDHLYCAQGCEDNEDLIANLEAAQRTLREMADKVAEILADAKKLPQLPQKEQTMKINESSLRDAVIEYLTAVDSTSNHVHLRIGSNGEFRVDIDTGYCISEAEFNHRDGCDVTVRHEQGNGQCNLADDWHDTDDGIYSVQNLIDVTIKDLERSGMFVELES